LLKIKALDKVKNKEANRIYFLDAMRGIAALMVVYFHYSTNFLKHYPEYSGANESLIKFKYGGAGVELFFIISGFVILMTLERSKKLKDFVVSRISRLYPPYWFALIFTSISLLILPITHADPLSLAQKLANILMFHTWFGIPNIDGVYWTLGLELVFYTLMALLFVYKLHNKLGSVVFWIFNVLFLIQFTLKFFPEVEKLFPYSMLKVMVDQFSLRGYGSLFMAGMLFYSGYKNKFTLGTHVMIFICWVQYVVLNYQLLPEHCIISPLFFVLFYLCTTNYAFILNSKVLLFFGAISYSLYLIHAYFGYGMLRVLNSAGISGYPAIGIVFGTVVLASWIMNKFVEVPMSKSLKQLILKWFPN
jgi:peptidoglycan/LPS O-acetylase OafA/YrhL